MAKEHNLELLHINTVNEIKICIKLLSLIFIIGLKKKCYQKTGNKRRHTHISLGDNSKFVVILLYDHNSNINKALRLN